MIILDLTTRKLEIVLAGAVTANQLQITVTYFDQTPKQSDLTKIFTAVSASNSTTDATILAAPPEINVIRNVKTITVYNKDTASATPTIKIDDSGTETILVKQVLLTTETLHYEDGSGWQII